MANIINAIINLINNPIVELGKDYIDIKNRANGMGQALEEYIKDLFAGTIEETSEISRLEKLEKTFSYLGNQNNPPDSILRFGDAIEVKKIENSTSALALNSSYPKARIFSNSKMISAACKLCETPMTYYDQKFTNDKEKEIDIGWGEKDIIYVVGVVKNHKILSLSFVYGVDYAADNFIYERVKNTIKDGVESIQDMEFRETNELGRVNRVDPLGITYLRIRGMWGIENPFKTFNYVYKINKAKEFNFMAIINDEKWETFSNKDNLIEIISKNKNSLISNIKIKDPNNPVILRNAKLITYEI